jgi:hypothetical protein
VSAIQCVVDPATNNVFVTGTTGGTDVPLVAEYTQGMSNVKSTGTGRLFVSKIEGKEGQVQWIQQFGTDDGNNEEQVTDLAIVPSIDKDQQEEAYQLLVLGHTTNHMFVLPLDAVTGSLLSGAGTLNQSPPSPEPTVSPTTPAPTSPAPTTVVPVTSPPTAAPTDQPSTAPTVAPTERITEAPTEDSADPHSDAAIAKDGQGFQSNWGPSYAGAMVYDFTRHSVYLTGSTYPNPRRKQSSCFLGHVQLVDMQHWKTVQDPITDGQTPAIEETENLACSAMVHDQDDLWVGGMNEKEGTVRNSPQRGFYTVYRRDRKTPDWDVFTAKLMEKNPDTAKVQIPQAMLYHSGKREMVVAIDTSDDDSLSGEYYKHEDNEEYPNLTAGGDYYKRGINYYVTYHKYQVLDGRDGPYVNFAGASTIGSNINIFVTGMRLVDDGHFALVGNVQGNGQASNFPNNDPSRDDMDGYVMTVEWLRMAPDKGVRFQSIENRNDYVHNLCESPDGTSFYVVGSTEGTLPGAEDLDYPLDGGMSAFVSKVLLETMEVVWTTQLFAASSVGSVSPRAEAFGCHVIPHEPSNMVGNICCSNKPFWISCPLKQVY